MAEPVTVGFNRRIGLKTTLRGEQDNSYLAWNRLALGGLKFNKSFVNAARRVRVLDCSRARRSASIARE
jgi:hypothetical protein